ncbi:putative ribonuclease H-like domain-containing protein, partial [Tanacetum coccineum]
GHKVKTSRDFIRRSISGDDISCYNIGIGFEYEFGLAGVVAIEITGGPTIDFVPGRKDSTVSPKEDQLPSPKEGIWHLRDKFYRMKLYDRAIVALLGAHPLAQADRSGFDSSLTKEQLKFDNSYFVYSVARTPQKNGVAERRNRTLIKVARTMLADSKLPTTFWAEAVSTACYVHNRVLVVKPHNKTPYDLFRGLKPALNIMRPFGCHVTILNTLDNLGKFDGKSDEGFFIGYSLSSKAFRVYNTRTRRVEENLHIGFLENKPLIEGNITQGELNAGTFTQKEAISQDCIMMTIWKDASYFDSPSKDVDNGEPKSTADDQKQVKNGPDNENDEKDKSEDDSSTKEVNAAGHHVNTSSLEVNTVDPSVRTAS